VRSYAIKCLFNERPEKVRQRARSLSIACAVLAEQLLLRVLLVKVKGRRICGADHDAAGAAGA
jgi:hypothetical protein